MVYERVVHVFAHLQAHKADQMCQLQVTWITTIMIIYRMRTNSIKKRQSVSSVWISLCLNILDRLLHLIFHLHFQAIRHINDTY